MLLILLIAGFCEGDDEVTHPAILPVVTVDDDVECMPFIVVVVVVDTFASSVVVVDTFASSVVVEKEIVIINVLVIVVW